MSSNLSLYYEHDPSQARPASTPRGAGPGGPNPGPTTCKTIKGRRRVLSDSPGQPIPWFMEVILGRGRDSILSDDEKSTNINTKASRDAVKFWRDLKDAGYIRVMASADSAKTCRTSRNKKAAHVVLLDGGDHDLHGHGG